MDTKENLVEKYLTPAAVILGAGLIALAVAFGRGGAPVDTDPTAPVAVNINEVTTEGEPYIGDPNAPVTMAFFYDIQCPFCKQFDQQVMPQLYENYVKTGKLKVVYKDFQFLGPDSLTGALYGRAVWDLYPAQFYAWSQAMAEAQDEEHGGFGDDASVAALTATIPGIDGAAVSAAVKSKRAEYEALINASRAEGSSLGVNGTPTVIIGDKLLSAISPSDFYAAISAEVEAES